MCCVCVRALQGKLQAFLAVAAQTLESFVTSLDEEEKSQTEDYNSHEHQFVLAVAGTITSESEASSSQKGCVEAHFLRTSMNTNNCSTCQLTFLCFLSIRCSSSNAGAGLPVKLSACLAGHFDETSQVDEAWCLPQTESVCGSTSLSLICIRIE